LPRRPRWYNQPPVPERWRPRTVVRNRALCLSPLEVSPMRSRLSPSILLGLVLPFFLGAAGLVRADGWPVPRGPSREPAPYRYDVNVWKTVPKAGLDDTSACILYYGTTHLVEADGTVEPVSHEVTRLNGRKGVERLGEYHSISFDPSYQKLTLNVARVLKPDGKEIPVEAKHVHLRDQGGDSPGANPEKQLVISFPNLAVGDVIE